LNQGGEGSNENKGTFSNYREKIQTRGTWGDGQRKGGVNIDEKGTKKKEKTRKKKEGGVERCRGGEYGDEGRGGALPVAKHTA